MEVGDVPHYEKYVEHDPRHYHYGDTCHKYPQGVATMTLLFSESRAYEMVSAILGLGIGVVLKIASRRFRTDLGSGFRLVEYCFYVFSAVALAGFVHQFFADRALFESEAFLNALRFVGTVAILVVIKRTIDGVKARNLADQPQ